MSIRNGASDNNGVMQFSSPGLIQSRSVASGLDGAPTIVTGLHNQSDLCPIALRGPIP
jgi:hypothetical protein